MPRVDPGQNRLPAKFPRVSVCTGPIRISLIQPGLETCGLDELELETLRCPTLPTKVFFGTSCIDWLAQIGRSEPKPRPGRPASD